MRACSRWSSGAGGSEDGVDLYLCLDSIDMGFFFLGNKHNKQVGVTFSPGCFFGVCSFQKKELVFFFGGGDVLKLLLKLRDFFGGTNTSTKISMEYHES